LQKNGCFAKPTPKRDGFSLRKCIYDGTEKEAAIDSLIDETVSSVKSWPLSDDDQKALKVTFVRRVRSLAEIFKHESFSEEAEWRIVGRVPATDKRSRWRTRHALIIPYVNLDVDIGSILTEIIVGPKVDKELATHSIDFLFRFSTGPVEIRESKCTLV